LIEPDLLSHALNAGRLGPNKVIIASSNHASNQGFTY